MTHDHPDDAATMAAEDSRVRVARERRERMRARLIRATMQVCADKGRLPYVIDEVIAAAGVSRGSFYKYYDSLEQLLNAAGAQLADEAAREGVRLMQAIGRPIDRTAVALQMMFARAAADRSWGAFVCRMAPAASDSEIARVAAAEFLAGRDAGDYRFESADAVVDLTLGALASGIHRIVNQTAAADYARALTLQILVGLGARPAAARRAVEAAAAYVRQYAAQQHAAARSRAQGRQRFARVDASRFKRLAS